MARCFNSNNDSSSHTTLMNRSDLLKAARLMLLMAQELAE